MKEKVFPVLEKKILEASSEYSLKDKEVVNELLKKVKERTEVGIATYGEELHTHNGRDVLQDFMEELLDAIQYHTQLEMEQPSQCVSGKLLEKSFFDRLLGLSLSTVGVYHDRELNTEKKEEGKELISTEFTEFCLSRLNKGMDSYKLYKHVNLLHAALGLVGETKELSEALNNYTHASHLEGSHSSLGNNRSLNELKREVLNEGGDCLFYLAIVKNYLKDLGGEYVLNNSCRGVGLEALSDCATDLAELVKKYVFQEREDLLPEVASELNRYANTMWTLFTNNIDMGSDFELLELTITKKLKKRYPEEFTPELSKNREE